MVKQVKTMINRLFMMKRIFYRANLMND